MPQQTPWIEKSFTDPQDKLEIAISFPQGCRRIKSQGDGAGKSEPWSAHFLVQISYLVNNVQTDWGTLAGMSVVSGSKDAFVLRKTYTGRPSTSISSLNSGLYFRNDVPFTVRVRRFSIQLTAETENSDPDWKYVYTSVLQTITGYRNRVKPIIDPPNTKLAKTALSVRATKQLTGQIEGINAVVHSYCKDFNPTTNTWQLANTNNPASLFLYVLTHPGNPQKIEDSDISSKIDLAKLQYWHQYCANHSPKFEYNSVHNTSRSLLDVLRDIAAAGRASPALVDGKWSVNIDEPKSIVQHFSPHNSWGFEASKMLPKVPDGLKIQFFNENKNYQAEEIIVYNYGKTFQTAELFESISLPGVTNPNQIMDHGQWHFAQIKLRPEIYTLNTDIEYLVCNRGDRVKVMHDVPMWGLGSGRIKNRISSNVVDNSTAISVSVLELDDPISLVVEAGKTYSVRIRSSNGQSIVRNLVNPVTGLNSTITLSSPVTYAEAAPGDLFLAGELNRESQDLIVLSIEPTDAAKNAKLTLVDYGVTETYNIFTDYKNLTSVSYDSNTTGINPELQNSLKDYKPVLDATRVLSNSSSVIEISPGVFQQNIFVPFTHDLRLLALTGGPTSVSPIPELVQVEYYKIASSIPITKITDASFANIMSVVIKDVDVGSYYNIRIRYVTNSGVVGQWSNWITHQVTGSDLHPQDIQNFTVTLLDYGLDINWSPCLDTTYKQTVIKALPIAANAAEPSAEDAWNNSNSITIFSGSTNTWFWNNPDTSKYVITAKHENTNGLFSNVAVKSTVSFTSLIFAAITVDISNDVHQIPTDAFGANAILTESGTKIYVYQGGTLLKYDGVGTGIGRWRINNRVASNVTAGSIQNITNQQLGYADYATINDLTAIGSLDRGSIEYEIVGVDNSGTSFTVQKSQRFVKTKSGENPTLYFIESTTPVVYKSSPDKDTPGNFSAISILARKKAGNQSPELYGWIGITPYSGNTAGTEQFSYQQITTTPANNDTATKWLIKLYDINPLSTATPPARSSTVLDEEEIQVIFQGKVYDVQIESSNGTIFRVGQGSSTVLTARVFRNGSEVTSQLPASMFRWRRVSGFPQAAPNDDATWNQLYQSGNKTITISVDDIYARATFFCDIIE